jgi:hypothetical protein
LLWLLRLALLGLEGREAHERGQRHRQRARGHSHMAEPATSIPARNASRGGADVSR